MARYTGPVCRLCRAEGTKLFLKGDRCYTTKCSFEKRPYPPGMHGLARRRRPRPSDYALQLREKQKVRRMYGILEKQFRRYYEMATRKRGGVTGEVMLQLIESRLDNVVYRMGFAMSRDQARQMVRHGHIEVNGRKVDIPSYLVKVGSKIAVREKSPLRGRVKEFVGVNRTRGLIPKWVEVDEEKLEGVFAALPKREELPEDIQEHLIVEFYSR